MSRSLGILFLHHTANRPTQANLASIRKHNPAAKIATIGTERKLPDGYSLKATPEIKRLHAINPQRSSDWLVCSWFLQRRECCRKWWIVEWDTFCSTSVRDYYRPVWNYPFVASSVRLLRREPEWTWFHDAPRLPEPLRPFAMGAVPFLYLVSESVLKRVCAKLLQNPSSVGNSELRFSTAANACGFPPCGFSPPDDRIGWISAGPVNDRRAIFHPVKDFTS